MNVAATTDSALPNAAGSGPHPAREDFTRPFQFSLRTGMLTFLGFACIIAWLVQGVGHRLRVATGIERLGGEVSLAIPDRYKQTKLERWLQRRIAPEALYPLRAVSLAYADCGAADLAILSRCTELQRLDLDFCRVGDAGMQHLATLRNLRWLDLQQTGVTDQGLKHLVQLRGLQSLLLEENPVTDAAVPLLAEFRNLRYLRVTETRISETGAERLRAALPNCRVVQ